MITSFPTPILSVAADVVKELEGDDALCGLWALFTKCKESLKDGRRLENISWRLWYREMAAAQLSPASTPSSESFAPSGMRSPSPITPISESGQQVPNDAPIRPALKPPAILSSHSWHGTSPSPPAASRRLSTASAPTVRSRSRPNTVGRRILDILPGSKLDVPQNKALSGAPGAATRPGAVPSVASTLIHSRPVVVLPSVQLPRTPPQEPAVPFRVVVVNPTPHPTPPATPHISRTSTPLPSPRASTHLQPPPAARARLAVPQTTAAATPTTPALAPLPATPAEILQATTSTSREPHAPPAKSHDDIPKASDRRFFLQEGSPGMHSPDGARTDAEKAAAEGGEPRSHSSTTSSVLSNVKSEGTGAGAAKRSVSRTGMRKGREPVRLGAHHAPARQGIHRIHPLAQRPGLVRKNTSSRDKKDKDALTVGSASSNGSRGAAAGPSNSKAPAKAAAQKDAKAAGAHKAHRASPPKPAQEPAQPARRGIVLESSDETTDTDDDSEWASEENVTEEANKTRKREEARLQEAAEEARRQRDMFAKVPKRSYTDLNRSRSGLLSQLLNPDPSIFPPNHPYRTSYSSQDITQLTRHSPGLSALTMSKSSAAVPLAAQVTAQAPPTDGAPSRTQQKPNGAYRPKARPQGEELEESSDSESERPENALQVSRSLAQQKLAALADPARRRNSDRGAPPAEPIVRPQLTTAATAPIPLAHPYNLPAPALPMTPRTTRRQMLATELSESLRRQLLWERQVSKINMTGPRRGGVLGNGVRPLTAANGEGVAGPAPNGTQSGRGGGAETDEEQRRRAQRNRSWADDYHYAGW